MVETSSYSSEFIALKAATKSIKEIRNYLRSLGIEVRSPTRTRCDNRGMVCNNAQTDSSAKQSYWNRLTFMPQVYYSGNYGG